MNCLTKLHLLNPLNIKFGNIHSNAALVENCVNVHNRNPRNLELLRIARKPTGYHIEKPGREFWHKLTVTHTSRYITLEVEHYLNGPVVSASSKEWAIKKRLYRTQDSAAYINLGRILAQRCMESGIMFIQNNLEGEKCEKINLALKELINGGLILTEPTRYVNPGPWDCFREEKPWEIQEK